MSLRAMKICFVCTFALILGLPIFLESNSIVLTAPLNERRELKSRPQGSLFTEVFRDSTFGQRFEEFVNDHYGMRTFLIRLKNQIDYSLFNYSSQVLIGKQGWLADRSAAEQAPAIDHLSDEQWSKLMRRLQRLQSLLKGVGIDLVLVSIPLKVTYHSEQFANLPLRPEENGYMKFNRLLKSETDIDHVDIAEVFRQEQSSHLFFYKTDLHWNEFGAWLGAKEIIKKISIRSQAQVPWKFNTQFVDRDFAGGGDSAAMGLLHTISEKAPFLDTKSWTSCGEPSTSETAKKMTPYDLYYVPNSNCAGPMLPQVLVVGNSFMLYFYKNGFLDHFERTVTLHDLRFFPQLLSNIPKGTKTLVWMFFEAQIAYQLQLDSWWEQLDKPIVIRDLSQLTGN